MNMEVIILKDRINFLIEKLNISKSKFAEKLNISQAFVSQICSGAREPSDRTIADICRVFGVREKWLREGDEPMYEPAAEPDLEYINVLLSEIDNPFTDLIKSIMSVYMELDAKGQENVKAFAASLSEKLQK